MRISVKRSSMAMLMVLCFVVMGQGGFCSSSPLDSDLDGILDDGDNSGVAGDNPCTGGITTSCDDNCPQAANTNQVDGDGDGIGDVCDPSPQDPRNGGGGEGGTGGSGGGEGGGSGGDGGGSGGGPASTTVYLNHGATLGWTTNDSCETEQTGAATATGSTRIDAARREGEFAVIEQKLSLARGSAGTAFVECKATSEFTVQADPDDSDPTDPTAPPRRADARIVYESGHLAGSMDASNYAIVFLIDISGSGSASALDQAGYAYGDTPTPPTAFPFSGNYDATVPIVLEEGQTYSVNVTVQSGFGSAGAEFGQYDGGSIDFQFNIGNLGVEFAWLE